MDLMELALCVTESQASELSAILCETQPPSAGPAQPAGSSSACGHSAPGSSRPAGSVRPCRPSVVAKPPQPSPPSRKRRTIDWTQKACPQTAPTQSAPPPPPAPSQPAPPPPPQRGQDGPATTPSKLRRDIEALNARDRTGIRDAFACKFLQRNAATLQRFDNYRSALGAARRYYTSLPDTARREWVKHRLRPDVYSEPDVFNEESFLEWLTATLSVAPAMPVQEESSYPGNIAGEFEEAPNVARVHGYLLTWNGRWGQEFEAVRQTMALRLLPPAAMAQVVKSSPFYRWLWEEFKAFAQAAAKALAWPKVSGKMEISVMRKNCANLVHFHLAVTDADRRHRLRALIALRQTFFVELRSVAFFLFGVLEFCLPTLHGRRLPGLKLEISWGFLPYRAVQREGQVYATGFGRRALLCTGAQDRQCARVLQLSDIPRVPCRTFCYFWDLEEI